MDLITGAGLLYKRIQRALAYSWITTVLERDNAITAGIHPAFLLLLLFFLSPCQHSFLLLLLLLILFCWGFLFFCYCCFYLFVCSFTSSSNCYCRFSHVFVCFVFCQHHADLRNCVKVEVAVLGSPPVIVLLVSVDVKQY